MPSPFTPDQLASLSAQINQQLAELRDTSVYADSKGNEPDSRNNPEHLPVQWRAIEKNAKEPPRSFWQKFKRASRRDLCEEGGVLYSQWQRYRDLSSKSVLESFGAVLVAMGYSGNALQVLAVAGGVIVLHLSCTVICEEEEE